MSLLYGLSINESKTKELVTKIQHNAYLCVSPLMTDVSPVDAIDCWSGLLMLEAELQVVVVFSYQSNKMTTTPHHRLI